MKNILLTLFAFVACISYAQEINQFDENGERHGIWKKNYKNYDILRYEGKFDHGKEVGVFKFYENIDKKAVLVASRTFNDSNDIAEVKFVTPEGNTVSEGKMRGKVYIGKWLYYHKNSKQLMTKETYNDKGELYGERITYYLSGKLAQKANYKEGKLDGKMEMFYEQGNLTTLLNYRMGGLHGESKSYDANGNLTKEGIYKDDKKHGIWKYYQNGKLLREKDFTRKSKNPKYQKKQ